MAELARDEEAWWEAELERVAPGMLLEGKPSRGGGRAQGGGVAMDVTRLASIAPALQRRLLRQAAKRLGARVDFIATEALRRLALDRRAGKKLELEGGLRAERTPRELRMESCAGEFGGAPAVSVQIPGEIRAPEFGVWLRVEQAGGAEGEARALCARWATLRNWRAGDRVMLRHSGGLKKVKEVLERMKVTGSARALWPVLEIEGRIVWMRGAAVEPEPGLIISVTEFHSAESGNS
jgi:tRNA(Ile)-lysidine synthase